MSIPKGTIKNARLLKVKVKVKLSFIGLKRALEFQEVKASKISRQMAHKEANMSAQRTGRFYPPGESPSTYSY